VSVLASLRPEQWTKNFIVFAALIFARRLLDPAAVAYALAAFLIFCGLSGAVYLVNDVSDREADRQHPVKSRRPIASGALSTGAALLWALLLIGAGIGAAFWLQPAFGWTAFGYVVLAIAAGFVLRAVAGGVVISVPISEWLLVCTILLALFLGLSKRRHELTLLAAGAAGHRRILEEYDPYLLDQMIAVVAASTLVAYIIYCLSSETAERFGTRFLVLTVPFPIYGIFRYLYIVHRKDGGGNPSEVLLTDRPLLACVALWGLTVVAIIYRPLGS
jgi:4-hydroxybenzoate polyprenyltransferase